MTTTKPNSLRTLLLAALVATAGAFMLLFFYRLLGGYWFVEGELPAPRRARRRRVRRRNFSHGYYDD